MSADLVELQRAGILAVLRAPTAEAAIRAVGALVAGGVTGIEITYSTPDAAEVIRELDERHGDGIYLGAGTVLTAAQAEEASQAGARFLVSPGTDGQLVGRMLQTGATVLSGALTPTEVMSALQLGVEVIKVFPASLGGPGYLRALRGPFPEVNLVPTGGVSAANLRDWFAAGAIAVGAGSELCSPAAMGRRDWAGIEQTARQFAAALAELRGGGS